MGEISKLTGREYHLFNYYGAEDAEDIIIIMALLPKPSALLLKSSTQKAKRLAYS